jgi:O-antigen ligase
MVIETESGRAYSIGSWTIYGTILAATIAPVIALLFSSKKITSKMLLVLSAVIIIIEIFNTQTRGAIYGLYMFVLYALAKNYRRQIIVFVIIMISVQLLGYFNILEYEIGAGRMVSFNYQTMLMEPNVIGRLDRLNDAWVYIISHPFSGLGLGQPTSDSGPQLPLWTYSPYLAWGVSMGLFAMIAFVLIMLFSLRQSIKNYFIATDDKKIYPLTVFVMLVVWIVNQFTTGDSLTYLQSIESVLYFYAVIGIILGQQVGRVYQGKLKAAD